MYYFLAFIHTVCTHFLHRNVLSAGEKCIKWLPGPLLTAPLYLGTDIQLQNTHALPLLLLCLCFLILQAEEVWDWWLSWHKPDANQCSLRQDPSYCIPSICWIDCALPSAEQSGISMMVQRTLCSLRLQENKNLLSFIQAYCGGKTTKVLGVGPLSSIQSEHVLMLAGKERAATAKDMQAFHRYFAGKSEMLIMYECIVKK